VRALQMESWVVADAARRLGISRATMHRKMATLGISRPG
jgi:transcriptional regulator of acetoin/glycerol metabolism